MVSPGGIRQYLLSKVNHLKSKRPFGRFFISSGEPIRTTDLRVMSPTSYHCSTPQRKPYYRGLVSKSQVRVFVNDENPFTDASITQTISHCEGAQRS